MSSTSSLQRKKNHEEKIYHGPDVQETSNTQDYVYDMQRPGLPPVDADKVRIHEECKDEAKHRVDDAIFTGRIDELLHHHQHDEKQDDTEEHGMLASCVYI